MKVTTQQELDTALENPRVREIIIDSPAGVWLRLDSNGKGSSSVVARDSSRVEARGSSSVVARDSSRVVARGSSSVEAWDSSRVEAWDSSRVEARGSSSVVARGSSSVEAWDSSSVVAWDSSRVEAWDSSSVEARDSSRVEAWDSSRVEASKYVAIHLYSKRVTLTGNGVVIDVTDIDTNRVPDFLDYHGVTVVDGSAIVYKAVDDDLRSGRGLQYPIGETVTAVDWKPTQECGHGLHFGYRPAVAKSYFTSATRFLECRVRVDGLIALGDKVKAESCIVVREVDLFGDEVTR